MPCILLAILSQLSWFPSPHSWHKLIFLCWRGDNNQPTNGIFNLGTLCTTNIMNNNSLYILFKTYEIFLITRTNFNSRTRLLKTFYFCNAFNKHYRHHPRLRFNIFCWNCAHEEIYTYLLTYLLTYYDLDETRPYKKYVTYRLQ